MSKTVGHDSQSPPRRAVIYARISDDRSGEALGVERQETECRAEAERLGYRVALVETDNSISAYSGKRRPGFEAVLEHVRAGRADVILCWHLDRLARQIKDLQRVLDLCTGRNAPCPSLIIHPARGSEIRGDDWSAQLTASILTLVANFESAHKGERVAAEARQRALTGRLFYPKVYGYSDDGDRAPVERQASAVQTAYATFLRTRSVAATHRALKAADPKGAPAGESGTRKLLQRAAYAGIVTYRGVEHPEVQALWEPLVPEPDWRTTQAILSRPSRLHGQHDRGARTNLLSGLAQCGRCGGTMRASSHDGGPNTGRYRGLTCRDHLHLTRKAFPVEAYVIGLCMARLGLPDAQATVLPRDPDPGADSLVEQWNSLTSKRSALADMWMSGAMPDSDYRRLSGLLGDDLAALEERLARLQVEPESGTPSPRDPAYALVGAPLSGLRASIANLMDITILPVRPGRQPFRPESVRVEWRTTPAEVDTSGRAAGHRPSEAWWAEIQEWMDSGVGEAAEVYVGESHPPPLTEEQRRALWVALAPVADLAPDAEIEE